jgi:hypothetical protein
LASNILEPKQPIKMDSAETLLASSRRREARWKQHRFTTIEERRARKRGSAAPYFRTQDSLCNAFLHLATDPREFEGLKLLFPFVREAVLLGIPQTHELLASWMRGAFSAGHDLGRAHPELLEDVLSGQELCSAVRRVGVVQKCSEESCLTWAGLRRACEKVVASQWPNVPAESFQPVLLEAVTKSLRTGFAAATAAQSDPALCEFVWDIPERIGSSIQDIVGRATISAPLRSFRIPLVERLEHPLLRLGRELYPSHPAERDLVLGFLQVRLHELGVKSENICPANELELVDWIARGLDYGREIKTNRPELLERVFQEAAGDRLEASLNVVKKVVAEAGGTDPIRLLGPLKTWQKEVYGWADPEFYGQELARVAYFSDFAVWIPWVLTGQNGAVVEHQTR